MKKIKTLGIITMIFVVLIIAVFAVLALFGVFRFETDPESGKSEITFEPIDNRNPAFVWQTSETEGDITAVIKTEKGNIEIKLGDCAAAEKFVSLDNEGAFENAEFSVLAKDMFIQASVSGENFELEQTEYLPLCGAVAFVMDGEKAAPSFVIITAEELSGSSRAFLSNNNFGEEKTGFYKNFGGIPEYEGKIIVFGTVTSGFETLEKISSGENSGYTGGYLAAEPVKINSVEISFPTEASE